ncbi:hypothetical protein RYX36_022801 [Vicia faba]
MKTCVLQEFNLWNDNLEKDQQTEATSYFTVIKRHSELILDSGLSNDKVASSKDLYIVPYSQEYKSLLAKSAKLLHKAGDITNSTSLKKLLHSKADAFLSNDYYESDIAWMELDSKLDITIGPYETYEDKLFGYKRSIDGFSIQRGMGKMGNMQFFILCDENRMMCGIREDLSRCNLTKKESEMIEFQDLLTHLNCISDFTLSMDRISTMSSSGRITRDGALILCCLLEGTTVLIIVSVLIS